MACQSHLPYNLQEECWCVKDCHDSDARLKDDAIDRQLARVGVDALAMLKHGQEAEGCSSQEEA
jgi:hypothetical protein